MMRVIFQRQMLAGESMDNSASAIYLTHVEGLVEAYAKASPEQKKAIQAAAMAQMTPEQKQQAHTAASTCQAMECGSRARAVPRTGRLRTARTCGAGPLASATCARPA